MLGVAVLFRIYLIYIYIYIIVHFSNTHWELGLGSMVKIIWKTMSFKRKWLNSSLDPRVIN